VLETDSEFANLSPHQMYLSYHFYKENLKGQAETISPKARLENLKDLRKNKLISEAEYKSAKQRILDTI
jgi:hypothetical protein